MTVSRRTSVLPALILILGLVGFVGLPYWMLPPCFAAWTRWVAWGLFVAQLVTAWTAWWLSRRSRPLNPRPAERMPGDRFLFLLAVAALAIPLALAVCAASRRPIASCGDEEAQVQYVVGMFKQVQMMFEARGVTLNASRLAVVLARVVSGVVVLLGILLHWRPAWRRYLLRGLVVATVAWAVGIILFGPAILPYRPGLARYPPLGKVFGILLGPLFEFREIGFRLSSLAAWALLCAGAWRTARSLGSRRDGYVAAVLIGCIPLALNYAALAYVDLACTACGMMALFWLIRYGLREDAEPVSGELVLANAWSWTAFMFKETGIVIWLIVLCGSLLLWVSGRRRSLIRGDVWVWPVWGLMLIAATAPYLWLRMAVFGLRAYGNGANTVVRPLQLLVYPSRFPVWLGVAVVVLVMVGLVWLAANRKMRRAVLLPCILWLIAADLFLVGDDASWIGYARFGLLFLPPLVALAGAGVHAVLDGLSVRASTVSAALLMLAGLEVLATTDPFSGDRFRQYGTGIFLPYGQAMEQVVRAKGRKASVLALQPMGWLMRPDAYYAYRAGLSKTPVKTEEIGPVSAESIRDMIDKGNLDAVIVPVAGEWRRLPWEGKHTFADDPLTQELLADPGLTIAAWSEYQGNQLAVIVKTDAPRQGR